MTKEALLVIDVQNDFFSGAMTITYPSGSFVNILQAMDAAHAAQIPVVIIQHSNHAPDAKVFKPGSTGWEIHPEVKKRPHEVLIEKTLPGSFTNTILDAWLRDHAITSLIISGYVTPMCCDTTSRQAFHKGYHVKFLSDATGTFTITNRAGSIRDAHLHREVLDIQRAKFSQVLTTAEWIRSLPPQETVGSDRLAGFV
jgi:nicotinamidase-related amidase